jgi:hypothetical protein
MADKINDICMEKHKNIDEHLERVDAIMDDHGVRIGALEVGRAEDRGDIKSLCKSLDSLTATNRWFIGLVVGEMVIILGALFLKKF